MGKKYNRKSSKDRKAQAKQLQARIVEQVEQFVGTEKWTEFLTFAASFHRYSFRNIVLINAQYPDASLVAGYRQWQKRGRQVRKGEKAIKIFGFARKKILDESDAEDDEEKSEKEVTYFPILSVFDISQTDAIEGREDETPTIAPQLQGAEPNIYDAVYNFITAQGWSVSRKTIQGAALGVTSPSTRQIIVREGLSPAQSAKTLIHETAHALMHNKLSHEAYKKRRATCEIEAESVAYTVAAAFGLDTSLYSVGYVAGWAGGDAEKIKATAEAVISTAQQIINAVEEYRNQAQAA